MPPRSTLWAAEEHTIAKHRILRGYLDAWIPILGRQAGRLVLVDGFAGPGRYSTGEDGSPLVMLKAYLEHEQRSHIDAQFDYVFIEKDLDRFEHLSTEVAATFEPHGRPLNVNVELVRGEFADVLPGVLAGLGGTTRAAMFVFVDPFGYAENPLDVTSRVLALPKCEVLVYVPLPFIARFLDDPAVAPAFTLVFGDERWREAIGSADRVAVLRRLFKSALCEHAVHVRSFEMVDSSGSHGYDLFFGSQSNVGLGRMKTAMWHVDSGAGLRFRDPAVTGQQVLFAPSPDLGVLKRLLVERFMQSPFSIAAAEQFVLLETPFLHDGHLKKLTLAPAERAGELEVLTSRPRKCTYPPGTLMRFKPQPARRPPG
jgi:three-Cys-motif partner protein